MHTEGPRQSADTIEPAGQTPPAHPGAAAAGGSLLARIIGGAFFLLIIVLLFFVVVPAAIVGLVFALAVVVWLIGRAWLTDLFGRLRSPDRLRRNVRVRPPSESQDAPPADSGSAQ